MEFQEILEKRKSTRKYISGKKVSPDMIREMLSAATLAPSWKNSQTARYYVVTSEEMLAKVKEQALPPFNANNVKDAPVLIVTSYVKDRSGFEKDGTPSNELGNQWGAYDLGLHNANLVLKATELGLDTLIMGIRDADRLRELLDISSQETIVSVIAAGYGDYDNDRPKRKAPEDIAKFF